MVTLAELKAFARIDGDDDDALVTSLGTAAKTYIEALIGRTFDETITETEKLAIKAVTAFWYENRGDGAAMLPGHIKSLIAQLRGGRLEPVEADE